MMFQNPIIIAVAVAGLLYLVYKRFSGGPLAQIPGPDIARWTNLRLKMAVLSGTRIHYVQALHDVYGPIVRLSPDEVAVADLDATKAIHKIGSGFDKSPWYQELAKSDYPGIFNMNDVSQHAARRRLLAQSFSKSNVKKYEDLIRLKSDLAVSQIGKESLQDGHADILKWFVFMANDLIGQLSFGHSFDMLNLGQKNEYIKDVETALILSSINVELPIVISVLSVLPIPAVQRIKNVFTKVNAYGGQYIRTYKEKVLSDNSGDQPTFFSKILAAGKSQELSDPEIAQEASNLIVAGSDTTANTITYLIWAVLKTPRVHQRILEELSSLPGTYTSQELAGLTYFNATIQESLRLYGAAPGGLPRIVPKGGRELGGYFIPEGLTVTTQAYTTHRDPSIFEDPLNFKPERWLNPSPVMEAAFMPFGGGSRICIGLHLAYLEIMLSCAKFFLTFPKAHVSSRTTDKDMELENYFLIAPKAHACFISTQ